MGVLRNKKRLILGIAACLLVTQLPWVQAESSVSEYEVKAAFLCSFAKFVEWPPQTFPDPGSPMKIGVLGADPFGSILEKTTLDQSVDGHKFVVKRANDVAALKDCPILFISQSESKSLALILDRLNGGTTLTLSDIDRFAYKGGMIGFVLKENKIRFQINLKSARKSGLEISSKVLRLAEIIEGPLRAERN